MNGQTTSATSGERLPDEFLSASGRVLAPGAIRIHTASPEQTGPLIAACETVADAIGVSLKGMVVPKDFSDRDVAMRSMLKSAGVRARRVSLTPGWYRSDAGPVVGFLAEDNSPVALIPVSPRKYALIDPRHPARREVTPEVAEELGEEGWVLFRPLPDGSVTRWHLLQHALRGQTKDILWILFAAVLVALLSLLIPVMTGVIINNIIPTAATSQLFQIGAGLVLAAVVTVLFHLTSSFALLRIEGKADLSLQAAVWDRLMSLRMGFFQLYSAGDLSKRVDGVSAVRHAVSETVANYCLSAVFSLANLLLIWYYSWEFALLALVLALIAVAADVLVAFLQLNYHRISLNVGGETAGRIFEILSGISKWKAAAVEHKALDWWAELFMRQQKANRTAGFIRTASAAFNAGYPVFTTLVNFALFFFFFTEKLNTGEFLAYNAAFAQMLAALLSASSATLTLINLAPVLERLEPIMQAEVEQSARGEPVGELTGALEVSHLAFRYRQGDPPVLRDISFAVRPGQFLAIVGDSGCGKSTLVRLLLGFERPDHGTVLYNGRDLQSLDLASVRRQLGVVLQHQSIFMGDIFHNIIGSRPLTLDEAWAAAEKAGLKEDIQRMPMGMETFISEGGGTFSGGQLQRIFIARALASNPKLLIFDEATSALDNQSQSVVSRNIDEMKITRVVIAHRLSTIRNADQILVLHKGCVAENGTYAELMEQNGLFRKMAERQIA